MLKLKALAPKLYSKNGTHFAPPTGCKISPHQRSSKIIKNHQKIIKKSSKNHQKSSKDSLRSLISIHFHLFTTSNLFPPRHAMVAFVSTVSTGATVAGTTGATGATAGSGVAGVAVSAVQLRGPLVALALATNVAWSPKSQQAVESSEPCYEAML